MDQHTIEAPRYSSLRDYLRVIRAQRVVIVLIALAAAGAALVVSVRQQPTYQAAAIIAFQDETRNLALIGSAVSPASAPDQLPAARAQTIDEPAIVGRVKAELRTPLTVTDLESRISTSVDSNSGLVSVTATAGDAGFAARLANVFVAQAERVTNARSRRRFAGAARVLRARFRRLKDTPANGVQRLALADQLIRVEFLANNSSPARVLKAAPLPGRPVSPRPVRNTALGLLLGLSLGLVAAFLRDALDRRLRGSHEIASELHYTLMGQVREEAMGRAIRAEVGQSPERGVDVEAFRIIRQNLDFLSLDQPVTTLIVTSALPDEGKSTVAASLALAAAASGKATLLVECDLRRPALSERLGIQRSPGLADYLTGDAAPGDILQSVAVDVPIVLGSTADGEDKVANRSLVCIAAGSATPHPAELLSSQRMTSFLEEVSEAYDLVVIDTSPLLPVVDTLELIPRVDGIVLCVRSARTTRDQARAAKAALEHFPAKPTGLVVTGLSARDDSDYGTYYSYSYSYAATSEH